jgi:CHAT domain-containing protein
MRIKKVLRRWVGGVLTGILLAIVLATASVARVMPSDENISASSLAVTVTPLIQQGQVFYQAEQYSRAVQVWQQANTRLRQQSDAPHRSLVLSYLARAYHRLGQVDRATETITASLHLLLENPAETTAQQQILGQVLNTQGNLQFALGKVEEAADTWQQAADAFSQAGDEIRQLGSSINRAQAEQSLGLYVRARQTLLAVERSLEQQPADETRILVLQSLGNVWRAIGELKQSRQALEAALTLAEPRSQMRSTILLSLGNTAQMQQDIEAASDFYQRAERAATDSRSRVQARLNQLRLQQLTQGNIEPALLREMNHWLSELPDSRAAVYARINYADLLGADPAYDAVTVELFADAVRQARRIQDRRAEAYGIGYLAFFYERRQQWADAQFLNEQALQLAQPLQADDILYRWQWQLGRVLKAQNQINPAIQAYEAAYLTLQSLRRDLIATSPDLQFSFRESVEPLYREFLDLLLTSPDRSSPERLQLARQVIESLRVAELDNFFRTACLGDREVAIDAVAPTAAAVIHPIILENRLELILSLPNEPLRQYTVPVTRQQLETQTRQWLRELAKPLTSPQGRQLGAELYDWLIRPLEAELSQHDLQTLVFVLDGALRNVPMSALFDGDRYLIEKYRVALAPGLQLLDPQPLQARSLQVLAAGLTEARHGLSALDYVTAEIEAIQANISGQILLDRRFTTQILQTEVSQDSFPIVHLATHGQFSSNLEETFVLAWDRPILINELRTLLRSRDDFITRPIELLVLSACETAAGDDRATLGLAGMAVQAGARSTLASLWSLDDRSGAEFMGQFYQALMQPDISKAAALQQAQLALLQNPNYRHPRYWAPYVLLGNWL